MMFARSRLKPLLYVFTGLLLCSLILIQSLWTQTNVHAATQATYYVSPTGDDNNPGTLDQPFQSIEHARAVVNTLAGNMSGDITVNLRGGIYTQSQTLQFGSADSGTNGYNVIYQAYPGEIPLVSGGQLITGWSVANSDQNIWQANVGTNLQTRQLYVNGVRASRASSGQGIPGNVTKTSTGYTTTDTSLQSWGNPSDIEFVYTGAGSAGSDWTESRCDVASITGDSSSTTIAMQEPCWTNGTVNKCCGQTISTPNSIENNYALLKQPGQWYLNHNTGILYYIPRSNEDLTSATVVAPTLETLVNGTGTTANPVHNLEFKGITFSYATWLQPSQGNGYIDLQAGTLYINDPSTNAMVPANVTFHKAQNIRFERNTFIHLGATALGFDIDSKTDADTGSQNNIVIGNVFTDISASGVQLGSYYSGNQSDVQQQNSNNQITDNYIYNVGAEYHGSLGIALGYTANSTIEHNEVTNVPYSGIADGLTGNPSYVTNNKLSKNLIHDTMKVLKDGGSIYTHGSQGSSATTGMLIDGNVLYDQHNQFNTIYTDDDSQYITMQNNVMYNNNDGADWGGCNPVGDMVFQNNYYTGQIASWCTTPARLTIQNNTQITNPDQAPSSIINDAGIEAAYQNIKSVLLNVDDNTRGSSQNQINYVGTWYHTTFPGSGYYNQTVSQSSTVNDYATFNFTGSQIAVYAALANDEGIVAFSIDGGSETQVDLYTLSSYSLAAVWTSPKLSSGSHSLTMRVSGQNPASSNSWFELDYVSVAS